MNKQSLAKGKCGESQFFFALPQGWATSHLVGWWIRKSQAVSSSQLPSHQRVKEGCGLLLLHIKRIRQEGRVDLLARLLLPMVA